LGSNNQGQPYFKVDATEKTVSIGSKTATTDGAGEYYFTVDQYGTLKCGGCTIKDYTLTREDGTSDTSTYIFMGGEGSGSYWSMSSSKSTYFYSPSYLYLSSGKGAVYLGGLTFGIVGDEYTTYKISAMQGKVLAKVV
jgi:hypothetical protein